MAELSQQMGYVGTEIFKEGIDMTRQHIVFLTGAGISVESGLSTFRGKDGMWTNEEWAYLASTDALYNDTQRCLDFYNWRRKQLSEVEPNDAHRMIAELEKEHDVTVITQNVDNLHERAGSSQVIHLHGELCKVCSMDNRTTCVKEYPLTTPIMVGDKADDGSVQVVLPFILGDLPLGKLAFPENHLRRGVKLHL